MGARPSRASLIGAIVRNDLKNFSRDRLWMILTPLSLVLVIGSFWLLPDKVEETIRVGLSPPSFIDAFAMLGDHESEEGPDGLNLVTYDTPEALRAAIAGETDAEDPPLIGVAFPADFVKALTGGHPTTVSVFVDGRVPVEVREGLSSGIRELAYLLQTGASDRPLEEAFPVTFPTEDTMVLGEDRAGNQVPMRERMRPLLAVMILLIETLALAGLVAIEIEQRTAVALLVTPLRVSDLLIGKTLTGAALGLSQGLFFLLVTRSFGDQWLLVLVLMIFGAFMMSGVGMIAGAAGKDFMSTLFYGIFFLVPLMIPAFSLLFPGSPHPVVMAMPSFGFIEGLVGAVGYGRGWSELLPHIAATGAWAVVLLVIAWTLLKRKVATL